MDSRIKAICLAVIICLLTALPSSLEAASNLPDTLLQGKTLEKKGDLEGALSLYRKALEADNAESVHLAIASLLGRTARFKEALAAADQGLRAFPDSTGLLNLKGLALFRLAQREEARTCWQRVVQLKPDNAFAKDWLKKSEAGAPGKAPAGEAAARETPTTSGSVESGAPETGGQETGGVFALAPAPNPGSIEAQKKAADALYGQLMATGNEDFPTIERLHLQVITDCPQTTAAEKSILMLSNMYEFAGPDPETTKQIALLEYLRRQYPGSPVIPRVMNRMINACKRAKRPETLMAILKEVLAVPELEDRHYVIYGLDYAKVLHQTGNVDQARQVLAEVIRRDGTTASFEGHVARKLQQEW